MTFFLLFGVPLALLAWFLLVGGRFSRYWEFYIPLSLGMVLYLPFYGLRVLADTLWPMVYATPLMYFHPLVIDYAAVALFVWVAFALSVHRRAYGVYYSAFAAFLVGFSALEGIVRVLTAGGYYDWYAVFGFPATRLLMFVGYPVAYQLVWNLRGAGRVVPPAVVVLMLPGFAFVAYAAAVSLTWVAVAAVGVMAVVQIIFFGVLARRRLLSAIPRFSAAVW